MVLKGPVYKSYSPTALSQKKKKKKKRRRGRRRRRARSGSNSKGWRVTGLMYEDKTVCWVSKSLCWRVGRKVMRTGVEQLREYSAYRTYCGYLT